MYIGPACHLISLVRSTSTRITASYKIFSMMITTQLLPQKENSTWKPGQNWYRGSNA